MDTRQRPRVRPTRVRHVAALAICCLIGGLGILQILSGGGLMGWLLAGFLLLGARFFFAPRSGELGLLLKALAAFVIFVAVFVAGVFLALESAEVVVVRYGDDRGGQIEDRLWVIDLEGHPSVTTGSDTRRVALIRASPSVELVRGDRVECRRATVIPAHSATAGQRHAVERLFREKYGYRIHASRALRKFFGGPGAEPVLIRLEPCG